MKSHIETDMNCCACGACVDICEKKAISLNENDAGCFMPFVDEKLCVSCGACVTVCPCNAGVTKTWDGQKSYIAINTKKELYDYSSSGGVFSAIATEIISKGGCVFGAATIYENDSIQVRHIIVDKISEIRKIQGSKYVRSDTLGVFPKVREMLGTGRVVLFSGTSCQIAGLKCFLKKNYENLITIDLVCHGVPEITRLQEYIRFLERRYKCNIEDVSFRRKIPPGYYSKGESYILSLLCRDWKSQELIERYIPKTVSGFFYLFLLYALYRPNCYMCRYASLNKPADLTLGDFVPNDYEIKTLGLDKGKMYSSVFVNTEKGQAIIDTISNVTICGELSLDEMVKRHSCMRRASTISRKGSYLFRIYQRTGFRGLQLYIDTERLAMVIPRKVWNEFKRRKEIK